MTQMVAPDAQSAGAPAPQVLAAYGSTATPTPLAGGRGTSWRAGDLVLKPDSDLEFTQWWSDIVSTLAPDQIMVPATVRSLDGRLVVDGWSATQWASGTPVDATDTRATSWLAVVSAGRALHQELNAVPRPRFIDRRHHRWAIADRTAWDEGTQPFGQGTTGLLARARDLVIDEPLPEQLIHGDLSGNVLLGSHPPAVIDMSPYWRPLSTPTLSSWLMHCCGGTPTRR
jgi:hypothetical protein